jgi:peptide/nickel transport system substrate-binding protein
LSILPKHLYEGRDWRTNPANDAPVGTGPFKFSRWLSSNTLALDANAQYFRPGPFVERVVFSAVSPDEIWPQLLSNGADYSVTRPTSLEMNGPAAERLAIRTLPSSARYYLAMNLRTSALADVRVRRALAAAIDRDEIVRKGMSGVGAPAIGWYTPDVEWAYNAQARVPEFDPAASVRLLDAARFLPGRGGAARVSLNLIVADAAPVREMSVVLRNQLARVGVELNATVVPLGELPKRVIGDRDFDLAIMSGSQGPDPDALRRRFLATTTFGAAIGYTSGRFADAVERGARSIDLGERAAAYREAQQVLAEDVPFIPLVESVKVVLYNRRVSGLPQLEARGLVGGFDFSLVRVADGIR